MGDGAEVMLSLDVIDDMLNRLTGRGTVTPTDALRELLEAIDTLEGVTFSRDLEPYKAEAVWEDAIRRAQDALAAAEKDESELVKALRVLKDACMYILGADVNPALKKSATEKLIAALDSARAAIAKHAKE